MLNRLLSPIFCLIFCLIPGCDKPKPATPSEVSTYKAPLEGMFYTVEAYSGKSAIDSDFTRVYAHLERNGKSVKVLVLSGAYLKVSNIVWTNPHENTICLEGGYTETYCNEVTLNAGGASETIHNYLQEHCKTPPTPPPASK